MKKTVLAVIAAALVVGLCACGLPGGGGGDNSAPPTEPEAETIPQEPQEEDGGSAPAEDGSITLLGDRGPLSEEGAIARVLDFLALDSEISYAVSARVEGADTVLDYDENNNAVPYPVYLVQVSAEEGVPAGRYAVGIEEDILWEVDPQGNCQLIPGGAPLVDWSMGYQTGAVGAVIRNPDAYCRWAMDPVLCCDASGGDPYAETVLICPLCGPATITLLDGEVSMEDWTFHGEETTSFTLDEGRWALIQCRVPEVIPVFAVTFSSDAGCGTYVVAPDGTGDLNRLDYAFPDGAVG